MKLNTNQIVPISEANQNFSRVARMVEKVLIGILYNEIVNAVLFEEHGSREFQMLVESHRPHNPGEFPALHRLCHKLLRKSTLPLILPHREVVERKKIIVYPHTVAQKLIACS